MPKMNDEPNYKSLLSACHKRCAQRTLVAIEKNRSIFIKLRLHLSLLNYLLPTGWCETSIPPQDKCPVSMYPSIEEMILANTGKTLDDYLEDFASLCRCVW
jgi:aarF domain-containing kinase